MQNENDAPWQESFTEATADGVFWGWPLYPERFKAFGEDVDELTVHTVPDITWFFRQKGPGSPIEHEHSSASEAADDIFAGSSKRNQTDISCSLLIRGTDLYGRIAPGNPLSVGRVRHVGSVLAWAHLDPSAQPSDFAVSSFKAPGRKEMGEHEGRGWFPERKQSDECWFSVGVAQASDALTVLIQGMQGCPAWATLVA